MRVSDRFFRLTAQVSLLLTLLALSVFLLLRTYLGDPEKVWQEGAVTEVVERGPVTIDKVSWQVESMRPYTRLADAEQKEIPVDGLTAGAVVIVVKLKLTPLDGLRMSEDGFTCEASLRDDRGNVWKSVDVFRLSLPTSCSDDDRPLKRNQAGEVAKVFVVPASAVERLNGIQVEAREEFRRVLITF